MKMKSIAANKSYSDWMGHLPSECDICHCSLRKKTFVDGKTRFGPWANMCVSCYKQHGLGLGSGVGQKYHYEK